MPGQIYEPKYQAGTIVVAGNTTIARGTAVKLGSGEIQLLPVTALTDIVHGFLDTKNLVNSGSTPQTFDVQIFREGGECYALALNTAVLARGAPVSVNAAGKIIPAPTAAGRYQIVGYALEAKAATTADALIGIYFSRTERFIPT